MAASWVSRARSWIASRIGGAAEVRRWESAETHRLNRAHWQRANDRGPNVELASDLATLRNRATYEMANNAYVRGIVHTYASDVVGARGPRLQVRSGDPAYDEAAERVWEAWCTSADAAGVLSLADMLYQWVHGLWPMGEYLAQIVSVPVPDGAIATRLLSLSPRRLATPPEYHSLGQGWSLGVRVNPLGQPLAYLIERTIQSDYIDRTYQYDPVPADRIIHGYRQDEPGQVRGIPYLAACLDSIADMRSYDREVLDAARAAAMQGVLLYTTHPDVPPVVANESVEIERGTQSTLPPGWQPMQIRAEQPMSNYPDFRQERLREIGRAVGMPLMMIRLDSAAHSYSSARFDGQSYWRGIRYEQARLERVALTRLVRLVLREAELLRLTPRRPADAREIWMWDAAPHVDPSKEAEAEHLALRNGTSTLAEACAARGRDIQDVIAQRAREQEALVAAGLPVPWWSDNEASGPRSGPADDLAIEPMDDGEDDDLEDDDEDDLTDDERGLIDVLRARPEARRALRSGDRPAWLSESRGRALVERATTYSPPQTVRAEARRGLAWRSKYRRGGTAVGVARARDLSSGREVSLSTIKRMVSYFARHEIDKQGEGWSPSQNGYPSAGRIAWALWGGDAGRSWAAKIARQADGE